MQERKKHYNLNKGWDRMKKKSSLAWSKDRPYTARYRPLLHLKLIWKLIQQCRETEKKQERKWIADEVAPPQVDLINAEAFGWILWMKARTVACQGRTCADWSDEHSGRRTITRRNNPELRECNRNAYLNNFVSLLVLRPRCLSDRSARSEQPCRPSFKVFNKVLQNLSDRLRNVFLTS